MNRPNLEGMLLALKGETQDQEPWPDHPVHAVRWAMELEDELAIEHAANAMADGEEPCACKLCIAVRERQ